MVKCSICGMNYTLLLRVRHRGPYTVKLCFECRGVERSDRNLFSTCSGCDCCR